MNNWKNIWNKRENLSSNITHEELLKLSGYDSGAGKVELNDFLNYIKKFSEKINLTLEDTLFDVGCGSGSFLYSLYKQGHIVGGIDYSRKLIETVKKAMPEMSLNFSVADACDLKTEEQFDIVLSSGVFHYFDDLSYAEIVLLKMLKKANKKIVILDINDNSKRDLAETVRRSALPEGEYEIKYNGLNHLYYEKEWFIQFAKISNCKIELFDQEINGYKNSSFRFNVIISKND